MTSVGYGARPFPVVLLPLSTASLLSRRVLARPLQDVTRWYFFSCSCLAGDIYATTEEERVRFAELSSDFVGDLKQVILRFQEWCFSDAFQILTFHR